MRIQDILSKSQSNMYTRHFGSLIRLNIHQKLAEIDNYRWMLEYELIEIDRWKIRTVINYIRSTIFSKLFSLLASSFKFIKSPDGYI